MKDKIKEIKSTPNWQTTSITIYCESVQNEATIVVNNIWSAECVYHKKWGPNKKVEREGIELLLSWIGILTNDKFIHVKDCMGPEKCPTVIKNIGTIYSEEK